MVRCHCSTDWNHRTFIINICIFVFTLIFLANQGESFKKHLTIIKSPLFPHHVIVKPGIGLIGVPLLFKDPIYHLGQFGSFKAGLALGSAGGAIGGTVTGKVLGKLHGHHHHKVIKKVPVPLPLPFPFPIPIKIPLPRIQINKEITQEEPVRYVTKTKYVEPEPEPEPEPAPRRRKKKKSHSHSSSEETEKVITINLGK